jgi:hypothetical protein
MAEQGIFGAFQPDLAGTEQMLTVCEGKGDASKDMLVDCFLDGELLVDYKFADVRKLADVPGGPFSS